MSSTPLPPPAAPEEQPRQTDCAEQLRQHFPALFGGGFKPLKLHIQADIQQRAPGVFTKQALTGFLRRHTGSTGYLIALTRSSHRYDLDGQPAGEVSETHRQAATEELARRRAQQQAKREQVEEGRRMRASLLRDFERTTLTPANFCALKGIDPQALDALLANARRERDERPREAPTPRLGAGRPPGGFERRGRPPRR
jgi:sRNA-binding protein